jgi:hypothetical protein
MDRKQMCVANVQYKKPTPDDGKRAKNLLRYLTYRESRDEAARYVAGKERWVDHGMGGSVAEIAKQCEALHGDHVLLFSLVTNPNPDLIAMVALDEREQFVHELTERIVEGFFEARGLDTGIEYSYVMHHRLTDDKEAPGRHNPHTHIVLPGTVYDEEHGHRVDLFFSQNRKVNHIDMLHDVTEEAMADLMELYVGRDWERRYDLLTLARLEQTGVINEEPQAEIINELGEMPMWCGVRQTDEQRSAVGYYSIYSAPTKEKPDEVDLGFRPLVSNLSHEEADFFAAVFAQEMEGDMDRLQALAEIVQGLTAEERRLVIEKMSVREVEEPATPNLSFDIDF